MTPIHILLVEDNEGDILLTREAFKEAKILIKLSVVRDGEEAVNFLTKQGEYLLAEVPDLLLLDINLPKKNGHEVLQFIKGDEGLKHIPVIILSTSSSPKDVNMAYSHYVNCFITKPLDVNDFIGVIASIENFWISIVRLPANKENK
ncbi:MAG: response regulator [Rhizobacter sp.]|nr:response regulator [Ferruginibacter sp.]